MRPLTILGALALLGLAHAQDPAEVQYNAGVTFAQRREHAKAIEAFTAALAADPKLVVAHDRRGDAYLKSGKFTEAIADFDVYLKANPNFAPEHWRRGIALYYAGRHADGVKQFETHKTVNPQDVENAVWHYLCNVKLVGKDKARGELIAVTKDTRVPMAEIQKLYAGKMTVEDVLAAVKNTDATSEAGKEARFYGHLYIALWYEAEGNAKKVEEHLKPAVEQYVISHYMWDVAKAHREWLKAKK